MRVGVVQFKAIRGDPARSRAELLALARAAGVGTDLLVLPEMAVTGYVFPDRAAVAAVAESPTGPTSEALGAVARERGTWLVAGFPERDGDRLYNSAMVLDREGRLAFVYRKTLLYEVDVPWAEPGDSGYATFDTGAGTFGVGICMDLNDDRFVSWWKEADPDAMAFPTNWVEDPDGVDPWSYWAWRMEGVRGALVAADTWGAEDHVRFTGRSCVLRQATVHAWLPAEGDGWARATLR